MCCFPYIHAVVVFIYKQQYIYTDENTELLTRGYPFRPNSLHLYTTIGHALTCFRHISSCSLKIVYFIYYSFTFAQYIQKC